MNAVSTLLGSSYAQLNLKTDRNIGHVCDNGRKITNIHEVLEISLSMVREAGGSMEKHIQWRSRLACETQMSLQQYYYYIVS